MSKHETLFDWWDAHDIPYNIVMEDENGFWVNHNRVAKDSIKRANYYKNPRSAVRQCGLCNVWGSTRKVQSRWWDLGYKYVHLMCISCWNKSKPLIKKEEILNECRKLANILLKEAREHGRQNG